MRYRTTITNKEDNSVGYLDYVWVDSKLISISFTSDELNQTVKYLYDDFGQPVGFIATREDGSVDTFYYLKNAQGDITHIVSAAGKKMVSFTYDAFGKRAVTYQANNSTTPGQIELLTQMKADLLNPFAYRGYCYDYDMGMYYLQSRYYDPEVGRFINSDSTDYLDYTGTVLGCNLFAYCENDPINFVDYYGFAKKKLYFIMGAKTSWNDIYLKSAIVATRMNVSYLKTPYVPGTFSQERTTNARKITHSGGKLSNYYLYYYFNGTNLQNTRLVTRFMVKTYNDWQLYIVSRHETIFDRIENKIRKIFKLSETDWEIISLALGDCELPDNIKLAFNIYDLIKELCSLLKKWFDSYDKYIMYCITQAKKDLPNMNVNKALISICWSAQIETYGFYRFSTGYRYGWKSTKKYYPYKIYLG